MKNGLLIILCVMLISCGSDSAPRNTGVFMLVDTSGTYTEELGKAEQIIRYTLSRLDATDSFAVARIDTGSFSEKDIVAKASFDDRPSARVRQREHLITRNYFSRIIDYCEKSGFFESRKVKGNRTDGSSAVTNAGIKDGVSDAEP